MKQYPIFSPQWLKQSLGYGYSGNITADMMDKEREECLKEDIGTGRYGCRCQKCCEGFYEEAENKGEE